MIKGNVTNNTINSLMMCYFNYWDINGNAFLWYNDNIQDEINFLYSSDYGASYQLQVRNDLKGITNGWSFTLSSLLKINNYYKFLIPNNNRTYYYTRVMTLDSNFNNISVKFIDSLQILKIKQLDNNGNYVAIGIDFRYPDGNKFDSSSYYILYSHDSARTWQKDFAFNLTEYPPQELFFDGDYLHITSSIWDTLHPGYRTIYFSLVDLQNKTYLNHYYIDSMANDNYFFTINKKTYLGSYFHGLMYINLTNPDIPTIEMYPLHGYKLWGGWSNDTIAYIGAIIGNSQTHYKLTQKTPTSVNEPLKTINTDKLWLSMPYPTPSQNSVKVNVKWNSGWDFGSANYGVVDLQGRKIAGKESISLVQQNEDNCTLQWDCSNITQGVYFLWARHGTTRQVVPVYVER